MSKKVTVFRVDATSQLKADTMAKWLQLKLTGDIREVPFVGPKVADKFVEAGVDNSWALLGQFMSLKKADMDSQALCDAFFQWLASVGVNTHRAAMTLAIAEKVELAYPGIFSRDELILGMDGVEEVE